MAHAQREALFDVSADVFWDNVRDVGAVHTRLAPGFVTDCRMEEGARVLTFYNGLVARELIVSLDDGARRIAYSARSDRLTHHQASLQVFEAGAGRCRVVWMTDLLPHEAAPRAAAMMDEGLACMRKALASPARPA